MSLGIIGQISMNAHDIDRATAFYAGLRAGELAALRWEDVNLARGVLRVERAWDPKSKCYVAPKSKAGFRTVPIYDVLRDILIEETRKAVRARHAQAR